MKTVRLTLNGGSRYQRLSVGGFIYSLLVQGAFSAHFLSATGFRVLFGIFTSLQRPQVGR